MIRKKKCICGKEFTTTTNAKYCSGECRTTGYKEYMRQYALKIRGDMNEQKSEGNKNS